MKFSINLSGKTIHTAMRDMGYAPAYAKTSAGKPEEFAFHRFLTGNRYPKFHVYAAQTDGKATISLHLDQKQPSYKSSHAHAAEHDGPAVQAEAERIREKARL